MPASAWMDAGPITPRLRLSCATHVTAARRLLGLSAPPCDCGHEDAAAPDHVQVCMATKRGRTFRHDHWVNAWRRVVQREGCSTCREPRYRTVTARTGADAFGLHRGDILATIPDGRCLAASLDTIVTHSWATSYAEGAIKTNRHAAAGWARDKRAAFVSRSGP